MYNPHFKPLEFEGFRKEAGLNAFTISPSKWIESTNAIGLVSKSGRYGGTFAHKEHPDLKGNIRDYASINELICLSNMENLNAVFIDEGLTQKERLLKLNQIAISQMRILEDTGNRRLLK